MGIEKGGNIMLKNKKSIIFITTCLLLIIIGIVLLLVLKNEEPSDGKIAYDDVYRNMKNSYETENETVDVVNNDTYYTVNIYNKETNELIRTFKIDATTGKTSEKSHDQSVTNNMTN